MTDLATDAGNVVNNNGENVTKISPVTEESTTETQSEVNTVPIGLGIAATGIAGSVGAVVLDSLNYKVGKGKDKFGEHKDSESNYIEYADDSYDDDMETEEGFDVPEYHASRDKAAMNKFYGEQINEYYEKEDFDK